MDDKGISYEMLQDLLRAERRSNRLCPVQPKFWSKVRDFLVEVTDAFAAEQEKDPFSRRAMMLRDEVQHAKQAAEMLWALRERKMALYGLAQLKDPTPKKPEGITRVEEEIYDALLATLKQGRQRVLDGAPPATEPSPVAAAPVDKPLAPKAPTPEHKEPEADESEPTPAPEPDTKVVPADTPLDDMVTIRATADIPPFVGPDMQTYLLKDGDVAMVPPAIAKLLERRGKAEPLDAEPPNDAPPVGAS